MRKQPFVYMTDTQIKQALIDNINTVEKDGQFARTKNYTQHGSTSCYMHCIAVAYYSMKLANFMGFRYNPQSLAYGALLHDYYLYDWHVASKENKKLHGFRHPYTALKNADRDYKIDEITKNTIVRHMFPLVPIPPRHVEGAYVCLADKFCCIAETLKIHKLMNFYKPANI